MENTNQEIVGKIADKYGVSATMLTAVLEMMTEVEKNNTIDSTEFMNTLKTALDDMTFKTGF